MNSHTIITDNIKESIRIRENLLQDASIIEQVKSAVVAIVNSYQHRGKVMFCGNGGSAADAQHLAAELSGKYYYDRPPLYAEALHVNTSYITAVANDYSFDEVYARMVRAMAQEKDILIALTTSGNSQNVVNAVNQANTMGCTTIGFTGNGGGKVASICDILIDIPSTDTPRIQECHMLLGHSLCELVEKRLFPKT